MAYLKLVVTYFIQSVKC